MYYTLLQKSTLSSKWLDNILHKTIAPVSIMALETTSNTCVQYLGGFWGSIADDCHYISKNEIKNT